VDDGRPQVSRERSVVNGMPDWVSSLPGAVTVSDSEHRIVYMNDAAAATWAAKGGRALLGTDLMACHNARSRAKIEEILRTGGSNVYTIEKNGTKKLIFQSAWRDSSGAVAGLVELSLVLPEGMPHFVRAQEASDVNVTAFTASP